MGSSTDFLSRAVPEKLTSEVESTFQLNAVQQVEKVDPWLLRLEQQIDKNPELATSRDYWKEIVPKHRRLELIRENHDSVTAGHFGIHKTYWRLQNKYFWPVHKINLNRRNQQG